MAAAPVRQVPGPQLCRMDLRKDLPPLLPASLLPSVPPPQVEEIHAGDDQHLLRSLPLLWIMVSLATSGQTDLGTKEKAGRAAENRTRQKGGVIEKNAKNEKSKEMQEH